MARSTRKNPNSTDRLSTLVKPMSQGKMTDVGSAQLRAMGGKAGNQALEDNLQQRGAMRDVLVRFAVQQLEQMHTVQKFEKLEMGRERQWFKSVAKGEAGYHLPDPTRWHEAALLYRRGVEAMCNGNMGHGANLMERALEAERAAYDSLPKMVGQHLDRHNNHAPGAPVEAAHVPTTATCPSCDTPKELRFADLIINMQDKMEQPPPINRRKGNAWWLEEGEEEEEEDGDDG